MSRQESQGGPDGAPARSSNLGIAEKQLGSAHKFVNMAQNFSRKAKTEIILAFCQNSMDQLAFLTK